MHEVLRHTQSWNRAGYSPGEQGGIEKSAPDNGATRTHNSRLEIRVLTTRATRDPSNKICQEVTFCKYKNAESAYQVTPVIIPPTHYISSERVEPLTSLTSCWYHAIHTSTNTNQRKWASGQLQGSPLHAPPQSSSWRQGPANRSQKPHCSCTYKQYM